MDDFIAEQPTTSETRVPDYTFPNGDRWVTKSVKFNNSMKGNSMFKMFGKHSIICFLHAESLQSCPTVWDPVDCSPPYSSIHEILQKECWRRLLCTPQGKSSQPMDWTHIYLHWQVGFFTTSTTWEAISLRKFSIHINMLKTIVGNILYLT